MATFNDINPQLKAYLLKHRLPDIFECIFTALAASKPADPNKFILEKLRDYQDGKHFDLAWDSFVSRKDLPPRRVFKRTFIENFFTLEDLAELRYYFYFQPSEEQKRLAAQAYNDALLKKHFRAWLGFYNRKKEKRRKALEEWRRAVQFHKRKLMVRTFQVWHAWKCERYRSQQEAAPSK